MSEKPAPKPRPYWHVDMKWIAGISLFFTLSAALLLFNLSALTERDRAVNISATIVASLFSKDGLDDEQGLAELRAKAALLPGDTIAPIPQFSWIQISKDELANLSASELRMAIFRQLTGPIYDKGVGGAAESFTSNPADQEKFKRDAALLNVFTKQTHETIQTAFVIAVILSVLGFVELVYFSRGWGRAVSPGVLLLLASPIGAIVALLLRFPPTNGNSPIASLPASISRDVASSFSGSYLMAAITGIVLLVIALVGKITQKIIRARRIR